MAKTKPQQMSQAAAFMEGRKRNGNMAKTTAATGVALFGVLRVLKVARVANFLTRLGINTPFGAIDIGNIFERIAGKKGREGEGNWFQRNAATVAGKVREVQKFSATTTMGELADKASAKINGNNNFVQSTVREATTKTNSQSDEPGFLTGVLNKVDDVLGINKKVERKTKEAKKKAQEIYQQGQSGAVSNDKSWWFKAKKRVGINPKQSMAPQSEINEFTKFATEELKSAYESNDVKTIREAQTKVAKKLEAIEKDYVVSGKVKGHIQKQIEAYETQDRLKDKQKFLQDPAKVTKKRLRNLTVNQAIDYTMRYGQVAAQGLSTSRALMSEKRALKMLIADIEGVDPRSISSWQVTVNAIKTNINRVASIFGAKPFKVSSSPIIEEAYKQYTRSYFASAGTFAMIAGGQEVVSRKLNHKANSQLASILITMGIGTAMNMSGALRAQSNEIQPEQQAQMMGGMPQQRRETVLELYQRYRPAAEQGQAMDGNMYLDLMTTASKDVRDIGGISSYKIGMLANYFMYKQTPVAEVMCELDKGRAHIQKLAEQVAPEVVKMRKQAQAEEEQAQAVSDQQQQPGGAVGEGKFTGEARNQPSLGFGGFAEGIAQQSAEPAAGVGVGAS